MKGIFEKTDLHLSFARRVQGFYGFPPMFHSHMEMVYVLKGQLQFSVDGKEYLAKAGQLAIVFPYAVHSYVEAPQTEAIILMFLPETVHEYEKVLCAHKPLVSCCEKARDLLPVMERIVRLCAHKDAEREKIVSAYLSGLIGELLLRMPLKADCDTGIEVTQRVLAYCAAHYADEKICIRMVAQALFISPSYVTKLFTKKLGYGFREYINMLRLSEAKRYLKNSDLKVTEIMSLCGFKNQSSFNRVFMEDCGVTPREYRAKTAQEKS